MKDSRKKRSVTKNKTRKNKDSSNSTKKHMIT